MHRRALIALGTAFLAFAGCGGAQSAATLSSPAAATAPTPPASSTYPIHPIRFIVPFAKGGGADVWGRFVAEKLGAKLGQPFVVENLPGEGGNRGTEAGSHGAGDGYTLLLGSVGPLVVHPRTYNHLPFDADKDFVPVGLLESSPLVLVVPPSLPAHSLAELDALAKANPLGLRLATNGNGSPEQIAGELFKQLTHMNIRLTPYDGAGPARADLTKGNAAMMLDPIKAAIGSVRSGKQRPLAIADDKRSPLLPDVPTFAELGYPDLSLRIWTGIFAPRGTPSAVIVHLNASLRAALEEPAVRLAIEEVGGTALPMSPEDVTKFLNAERAKWTSLVTRASLSRVDGPI